MKPSAGAEVFGLSAFAGLAVLFLSWRDMGETRQGRRRDAFRCALRRILPGALCAPRRFWGSVRASSSPLARFYRVFGPDAPFPSVRAGCSPWPRPCWALSCCVRALGLRGGPFRSGRSCCAPRARPLLLPAPLSLSAPGRVFALLSFGGLAPPFSRVSSRVRSSLWAWAGPCSCPRPPRAAVVRPPAPAPWLPPSAVLLVPDSALILVAIGTWSALLVGVLLRRARAAAPLSVLPVVPPRAGVGRLSLQIILIGAPARLGPCRPGAALATLLCPFAPGAPWPPPLSAR